jgi:2-hydroxy-6-oxonona-2,4-dienedioate hydrolase
MTTGTALRSVWDTVGGVKMHGLVSTPVGATPVVFVHGLGVSARYMAPTMALLAGDFQVAGPDLPGFGRSGSPPRALDLRQLAVSLEGWLDARGIGPAIFVGNSYGCQVILECVVHAPRRALGLVLNAPTMDPAHRTVLGQLLRVLADVPREPLRLALIVARDYLRAGPWRLLATLGHALADRVEEKLPLISAPTLVVCGAHDPVVTVRWASEVARLVGIETLGAPGAALQCVGDAAHALPFDDPDAFAAIIRNFAAHGVRAGAAR